MTTKRITFFLLFFTILVFSQGNNLTSSPYSLFGLGMINENNTGITNSLGKSGIALSSEYELNGLNPASLATIKLKNFFLDFGVKGDYNSFSNSTSSTNSPTFGFSNISFGFPLNEKSGLSISLTPFTEVGYSFQGIVNNIGGSTETYTSLINGSGGLNSIGINYGRKLSKKLNIGLSTKYLFGKITQTELVILENDFLSIEDQNYYGGFNLSAGVQYQLHRSLNLSSVVNLKSNINGSKDRTVSKILDESSSLVEDTKDIEIDNYNIPVEFIIGLKYEYKNYSFVSDYKRSFWTSLNQKDNIGEYVDSNVFGFGVERFTKTDQYQKKSLRYRIGYNFNDGNLAIKNKKISTSTITAGLGIPIGNNIHKSYLNISYSYGSRGLISNTFIRENYHSITFNFNFADIWFLKKKYE